MKRNKQNSTRAMRNRGAGSKPPGESKYARKQRSGRMMYGRSRKTRTKETNQED